jgi:hypothetical protein
MSVLSPILRPILRPVLSGVLDSGIVKRASSYDPTAGAAMFLDASREVLKAGGLAVSHFDLVPTWGNVGTGADAVQATSANQPLYLPAGAGYLYCPGVAGNGASLPHNTVFNFTGDFCIEVTARLPDWTPAAAMSLASKWLNGGAQRCWTLQVNTDGKIALSVATAGGGSAHTTTMVSTVSCGLADGSEAAIRAIRIGSVARFFVDGLQLGSDVVITSAALHASGATVDFGGTSTFLADVLRGAISRVRLWNTSTPDSSDPLLDADFRNATHNAASLTATTGQTVTVATSGTNPARINSKPRLRSDGVDDFMALSTPVPLNAVSGVTLAWHGTLHRVSGTQTLIVCASPSGGSRARIIASGDVINLSAKRVDADATGSLSTAGGALVAGVPVTVIVVMDYGAASAKIYKNGVLVASGSVGTAGLVEGINSAYTRIMAISGTTQPAAADHAHSAIYEYAMDAAAVEKLHNWLAAR